MYSNADASVQAHLRYEVLGGARKAMRCACAALVAIPCPPSNDSATISHASAQCQVHSVRSAKNDS